MIERYKVVPTVYLMLADEQQVLLGMRQNTGYYDGYWSLVAGHVERGENATEAITRETAEETGLHLEANDVSMQACVFRRSDDRENVEFFFRASYHGQRFVNNEPLKCRELALFPLNKLPEKMVGFQKHVIEQVARGERFMELGWSAGEQQFH